MLLSVSLLNVLFMRQHVLIIIDTMWHINQKIIFHLQSLSCLYVKTKQPQQDNIKPHVRGYSVNQWKPD